MINYDYDRTERIGMPEAIFCQSKSIDALNNIIQELVQKQEASVLFTRLSKEQYNNLDSQNKNHICYDEKSRTATINFNPKKLNGKIAIVTAGTSDLEIAYEASKTLEFYGVENEIIGDVGVAGIWRLLDKINYIRSFDIVITIAGMDAALASVMGGLVSAPIIAVPTSVGYGVAQGGKTALNSMLASCGQGISVTNIDNGFGSACAAIRILNLLNKKQSNE